MKFHELESFSWKKKFLKFSKVVPIQTVIFQNRWAAQQWFWEANTPNYSMPCSEAFWCKDFLHFHGLLTTFMKIFEGFATKLHSETSGKPFQIDIDKVIIISGADFDTG